MTELEFEQFEKELAAGYKEERRQKREIIAAIIFVPLFPFLLLLGVFIWNHIKILF